MIIIDNLFNNENNYYDKYFLIIIFILILFFRNRYIVFILLVIGLYYYYYDNNDKIEFLDNCMFDGDISDSSFVTIPNIMPSENYSYLKLNRDVVNFYYKHKELSQYNLSCYSKSLRSFNKIIEISEKIPEIDYYYKNYLDNAKLLSEICVNNFEAIMLSSSSIKMETEELKKLLGGYINYIENICIKKSKTNEITYGTNYVYKNIPEGVDVYNEKKVI